MIYRVYLRTAFIPYKEENKRIVHSLEEVNEILDNETEFTDYLVIGETEEGVVYTDYGKIDHPLVKRLKRPDIRKRW